jgi:peptidoglycan pentaglycine glycine transferase (the first glycine)
VGAAHHLTDSNKWDAFVERQGGHLLQTAAWGRLKAAFGWDYRIVSLDEGSAIRAGALLLFRRLPLGLGTIAYVPRGPVVDWEDGETVEALQAALDDAAQERRAIMLKIEPAGWEGEFDPGPLPGLGYQRSSQTIQPPRTIMLDISGSEDDILAKMNQGTRRKIRLASRRCVVIREGEVGDLASFHRLTRVTGARNEFGTHTLPYYQKAFELFRPGGHAALLMASYEGRDLGGLMAFAWGDTAWYLYGASSNEERDRMPNHALQWAAIRWARERGCMVYDLWGVPDFDEAALEAGFQSRRGGLWGVYGFKRGFGGRVVRTVGAWDKVYRPTAYALYTTATRLRAAASRQD